MNYRSFDLKFNKERGRSRGIAYSHADEIWHLEPLLEHSLSTDDSLSTACSKLFTTYLDSTDNCWKSTLWEMDMR